MVSKPSGCGRSQGRRTLREVIMREIQLSQGKSALVDDKDFDRVDQFKWCAQKRKNGFHAARYSGKKYVYMHCFILGISGVDHIDGNGLNNQMLNLRPATKSQNGMAKRTLFKRDGKPSQYRGVCWHKKVESGWLEFSRKLSVEFISGFLRTKKKQPTLMMKRPKNTLESLPARIFHEFFRRPKFDGEISCAPCASRRRGARGFSLSEIRSCV